MYSAINRYLDELGRLILPIEHRKALNWHEKDSIDIILEKKQDRIILRKSTPSCILCGAAVDLIQIKNKYICNHCKQRLESTSIGDVLY